MSWLSDLSATGSASCRASAHLGLPVGPERKHQPIELGSGGGEEEIALVALGIARTVSSGPAGAGTKLDIVAGGERIRLEAPRRRQQLVELDLLVAHHTRDQRFAGNVAVGERLHDGRLETVARNRGRSGRCRADRRPARIVDILSRTAGAAPAYGLAVVIKL